MTAIDRRSLLGLLAAAGFSPLFPGTAGADEQNVWLTTARLASGQFAAIGLGGDGGIAFSRELPGRGHDIAVAPDRRRAVIFARRPGRFAIVIDLADGNAMQRVDAAAGRHFFGHGFFSPDGRLLYATENAFDAEAGVIGVYDVADGLRRVGEFPGIGIEPHEALLLADGRTIIAADGGILTHPDFGREKLNLATMAPALVRLDRTTGDVAGMARLDPALHQLSIRHLAADRSGAIWFGCQYEGDPGDMVGLIGRWRPGERPELLALPEGTTRALRQYVGSVAANRAGDRIAVTSPRGGLIIVLDAASGTIVRTVSQADVCGIAPGLDGDFLASDGRGGLLDASGRRTEHDGLSFDNHLRAP
ncbi:MAG: DUF1513 domain-containing protein [Hyphomicrobiales bacterium]